MSFQTQTTINLNTHERTCDKTVNQNMIETEHHNEYEITKKQKRERILIDIHSNLAAEKHITNDYERKRQERIKRNEEVLKNLGLRQLASDLAVIPNVNKSESSSRHAGAKKERKKRLLSSRNAQQSTRTRGQIADARNRGEIETTNDVDVVDDDDAAFGKDGTELLELEDYFKKHGQDISNAIVTDGTFRGWVCPQVAEAHGIPSTREALLNAPQVIAPKLKGRGAAREKAAAQLRTNPNAYFYRLVAPGQQQAQGAWTEEEHEAFLQTARQHGVGDNWGLFASYIPCRVGYQCAAYMREVIVPSGLVLDKRFRMTEKGRAVFVG